MQLLVEATKELLEEKNFDEISVAEIAHRAGSSVGAFYARFNDKEGLLEHLGGLVSEEAGAEVTQRQRERDWEKASFEVVVGELMGLLVWGHRRGRGTLRALMGRALGPARAGNDAQVWEGFGPAPFLVEQIVRRRGEITHPDPDIAVHLGLMMAASAVRDRILFPEPGRETKSTVPMTDAVFVGELTRAFVSFLGVKTKG